MARWFIPGGLSLAAGACLRVAGGAKMINEFRVLLALGGVTLAVVSCARGSDGDFESGAGSVGGAAGAGGGATATSGTGGGASSSAAASSSSSGSGSGSSSGSGSGSGSGGGAPCDASNCVDGCCANGLCSAGTSATSCGNGGQACQDCASIGWSCSSKVCVDAQPQCNPQLCPNGCCQGGACKLGFSDQACGTGGIICIDCSAQGLACLNGHCTF